MLWEVEIQAKGRDLERDRVCEEFNLLTHGVQKGDCPLEDRLEDRGTVPFLKQRASELIARTARGYLLQGNLERAQAEQLVHELLVDPLVETGRITLLQASVGQAFQPDGPVRQTGGGPAGKPDQRPVTVL